MKHRRFLIPTTHLDLFLTALFVNFTDTNFKPIAQWIFQTEEGYDVIVKMEHNSPTREAEIEQFVKDMKDNK